MKIAGWICISIGGIALLGVLVGGGGAFGPLFFLGVGLALISSARQKKSNKNSD